jgi:thiamine-monophosphate kinase
VVEGLYEGLAEAAKAFGTKLVGGETTSAKELALSVAILGSVEPGQSKGRSGARAGDRIWISGFLGDAAAGLAILKAGGVTGLAGRFDLSAEDSAALAPCVEHHQRPRPRLALGKTLGANPEVTAMMDVSDGLAIDLHRLARASGLAARLRLEALPLSPGALLAARLLGLDPLALALGGGDDYELLVCSTQDLLDCDILQKLIPIGRLEETDGLGGNVLSETGEVLPLTGWDHFA